MEEEGFSCASFDYCGNTTECRLSTASMKNIGQVSVIANLYCDVYSSKYNITFSKYNITFSKSFVCVEVLRPSQPSGVMSSAVSLPNHTFTGQA